MDIFTHHRGSRYVPVTIILLWSLCAVTRTPAREAGEPSSLTSTLLEISSLHPAVRRRAGELAARISAAKYAAYFYPDPKLALVYSNLPSGQFVYNRTPMTGIEVQLRQPIPFPGRLTLRARIADDIAELARLNLAREKNALARDYLIVQIDIARLSELERLTRIYGRQIRLVSETARTGYAVGRGNLSDLTRANLLHSGYQQKAEGFAGMLSGARERGKYFYEGAKQPVPSIDAKDLRDHLEALSLRLGDASDRLAQLSLDIASAKIEASSGERKKSLARYDYLPDFEIFAAYRQRDTVPNDPVSGEDFTSVGISMRLPLWSAFNNHNQVRAREAGRESRVHARRDAESRVLALERDLAARQVSLAARIKMFDTRLIPQGRRAVSSSRLAYQTGGVDFDTLLDSRDTLYNLKAERIELQAARAALIVQRAALYNMILPEPEEGQ